MQSANAKKPAGGACKTWTYRPYWPEAKNVTIDILYEPEPEPFGSFMLVLQYYLSRVGQEEPNVFEGSVDDFELLFKDKQTISVTIKNAYVEGLAAIPYTDCEVYTPLGYHTEV